MTKISIDISKSKKTEKLVIRQWLINKLLDYLIPLTITGIFIFMSTMELKSDLENSEPIALTLTLSLITISIGIFVIYSLKNLYKLERIKGLSREQNSVIIKEIAEKNGWNISTNNQQISTLNIPWENSGGLDWGKQLTIIYDKTDILVNCVSFGLHSTPSPFHWFTNKRKINKLKMEFKSGIKTFYNNV
ncbi:hypothetical protein SAMN04487989_1126 [Bizionia echini]|uniref:Uncharacterized protein n=1 Tax=Bizionia echini TaxID=649333 RepID=A0A1I5DS28_9FLAO|nr:hypothetical protein [Bizionia echini]SFO02023.1 hypothetical protein SAMN04487989_1126 [Bizionia echini]